MKKNSKKLIVISLIILVLIGFYKINELNYTKHKEIKRSLVDHPENLPKKEIAKDTSFWFSNLRADIYWLEAIQYIWWNAIWSEYKKYLYLMLDLITELNPYFEHPYKIGLLLLPSYNERYEDLSIDEQNRNTNEAIKLWLKWIEKFCDKEKIELIKNEDNLEKIWTEKKYINPCLSYEIPYSLAFVYYYYKKDPKTSADYYKIASAVEWSLSWARTMAAIMSWKWWNREKSYFMFLSLAKSIESEDLVCMDFASTLEKLWIGIFINKDIVFDSNIIKEVEKIRDNILGKFDQENELEILSDMKCWNYLHKAIRELNLYYVELANEKYEIDNNEPSYNANQLFEEWYLDYLPIDFQQYDDYWIIYKYNKETWNYDYKMWNY